MIAEAVIVFRCCLVDELMYFNVLAATETRDAGPLLAFRVGLGGSRISQPGILRPRTTPVTRR
jgi:hypothetical protein